MSGTGAARGGRAGQGLVCPLRRFFPSGTQFDPTATIASFSISDWWDVCLEIPRVLLVMDALYQLTHLPAHTDARLALLWGDDSSAAPRLEVVSSFRPSVLVIETPADGALCSL